MGSASLTSRRRASRWLWLFRSRRFVVGCSLVCTDSLSMRGRMQIRAPRSSRSVAVIAADLRSICALACNDVELAPELQMHGLVATSSLAAPEKHSSSPNQSNHSVSCSKQNCPSRRRFLSVRAHSSGYRLKPSPCAHRQPARAVLSTPNEQSSPRALDGAA